MEVFFQAGTEADEGAEDLLNEGLKLDLSETPVQDCKHEGKKTRQARLEFKFKGDGKRLDDINNDAVKSRVCSRGPRRLNCLHDGLEVVPDVFTRKSNEAVEALEVVFLESDRTGLNHCD